MENKRTARRSMGTGQSSRTNKFRKISELFEEETSETEIQKIWRKRNLIEAENNTIREKINEEYQNRKFWDGIFYKIERELKHNREIYDFLLLDSMA